MAHSLACHGHHNASSDATHEGARISNTNEGLNEGGGMTMSMVFFTSFDNLQILFSSWQVTNAGRMLVASFWLFLLLIAL